MKEISREAIEDFASLFRGRTDAHGQVNECIYEPVTLKLYEKHLKGEANLGIYFVLDDSTCHFAKSRGWEVAATYEESESAWKTGHQRKLARLLADCRDGRRKYDAILLWSLDRLTREGIAKMLEWVNTFKGLGVKVISLNESWTDSTGPMLELLYAVCAWAARYESERKSERVKAGLARAVKSGSKLGRPKGKKDKEPRRKSGYYSRWVRGK